RWTTSLEECLAWPDVQGVIVCTPNDTHADVGLAVLRADRHLLMEKPLALDLAGADALIEAADQRGLVLMPGQSQRFYDTNRAIREAVVRGDVGRPSHARATFLAGWLWGGWGSWVLDPARSGGHVVHNGVHGIDLVSWWLGARPVEVLATGGPVSAAGLGIADHFTVHLRTDTGATAIVEMSRAVRPRATVMRELVVAGSDGVVRQTMADAGGVLVDESGSSLLGFDGQDGFDREVGAWVATLADGVALPVTAADGRAALAAAIAAERSLITGRRVRVAGA
ncbi:MAG: Gfo/Idh/MocA family oxidoreductase, partial [Chloroflexi bacterium]|nr:Gfo/Idh/MocA family oxidoreductase [Chloroflexota bacterium]